MYSVYMRFVHYSWHYGLRKSKESINKHNDVLVTVNYFVDEFDTRVIWETSVK